MASLLVLTAAPAGPAIAQQKVELRRAVTRDVYVRISGSYASLRVQAWTKDSLALTGTLPAGARFDPAIPSPKDPPTRGAKFYIEAPAQGGAPGGSLDLFVPAGATVWAKAGNATLEVAGIAGGLDLNLVGGSITVQGAPRELNVESMDGKVEIAGSPAWMRVKTATGAITVRGSVQDAGVTTVGGTVQLLDGTYERARIESVTGSILFAGTLSKAANLTVDSHSGEVELRVGSRASMDVEATTIAGSILNAVNSRRPTPGREGRGEDLTLNLGVGDARATVRTFKGNIRLTR
jgi:DUF4097 and DUF4098 domain-containing protein YvlB